MPMCSGSVGTGGGAGAWGAAEATAVDDTGLGSTWGAFATGGFAAKSSTDGAGDAAALSVGGGASTTDAGRDTAGGSGFAGSEEAEAGAPAGGGPRPPKTANPPAIAATPSTPARA